MILCKIILKSVNGGHEPNVLMNDDNDEDDNGDDWFHLH